MALLQPFSVTLKTSHNSHKFGFTLTPTNYGFWKNMVQPFLVTNNLFSYIDGTIPCPSETLPTTEDKPEAEPNPNYATWVMNDAHVRTLLVSTISESAFQHVQGTTSRELWLALEQAFAPNTTSRLYTIKNQLQRITMQGDETPAAYLLRAQSYATALANIGHPVKEPDLVMFVVSGLREEYNGLKSTLLTRQSPTSFSELPGLIADHDYMIKKSVPDVPPVQAFATATISHNNPTPATSSTVPSETLQALQQLLSQLGLQVQPATNSPSRQPPQAFYSNRSATRGRGNRRNNRGSNNNTYHNQGNRNQFSWASNQNVVYGSCNRCGIGHLPSQCPNRDPTTMRQKQPSANFADFRSQASTSNWLPDTGSSNHVSPDFSGFEHLEPYYGEDNLHVGNGQFYPHHPPHGSK